MMVKEVLETLKSLGDPSVCTCNVRNGASSDHFGVKLGDIRRVAKEIKTNHGLGMELWKTGIIDARLLAILLIKPRALSVRELDGMVRSVSVSQVADWMNAYVAEKHPDKETLREKWMEDRAPWVARAGWALTAKRIAKNLDGIDLTELLVRIESSMAHIAPEVQWTMNSTLVEIGIRAPQYRDRAIAIGEKLGIYRDYPVSKGCTSPFAPIWINEMVRRQA